MTEQLEVGYYWIYVGRFVVGYFDGEEWLIFEECEQEEIYDYMIAGRILPPLVH